MKNSERERFINRRIEINIDGYSELWELERVDVGESKMYVTYKLKEHSKYKTDV